MSPDAIDAAEYQSVTVGSGADRAGHRLQAGRARFRPSAQPEGDEVGGRYRAGARELTPDVQRATMRVEHPHFGTRPRVPTTDIAPGSAVPARDVRNRDVVRIAKSAADQQIGSDSSERESLTVEAATELSPLAVSVGRESASRNAAGAREVARHHQLAAVRRLMPEHRVHAAVERA